MVAIGMIPAMHVPQIPSSIGDDRLPVTAEVAELDPAAGDVVAGLHQLLAETFAAIRELVDARLGGRVYQAAEDTDRRSVAAGKEPTALAALISSDPKRYGRALALANSVTARMDRARQAGNADLDRAGRVAGQEADRIARSLEDPLAEAWASRGTGRGLSRHEECTALMDRASHLRSLADWLLGKDRRFDDSGVKYLPLSPRARGFSIALDSERTGNYPMTTPVGAVLPEDFKPRGIYA